MPQGCMPRRGSQAKQKLRGCRVRIGGESIKWLWLSSRFGTPFWKMVGEFTTHFRTCFSGDWDVHWGCGLLTYGQIGNIEQNKWNRGSRGLNRTEGTRKNDGFSNPGYK